VLAAGIDIEALAERSEADRAELERFLAQHSGGVADYAFVPLICRYAERILVLRRDDGKIVSALDVIPVLSDEQKRRSGSPSPARPPEPPTSS
jgi:hypothetical protein